MKRLYFVFVLGLLACGRTKVGGSVDTGVDPAGSLDAKPDASDRDATYDLDVDHTESMPSSNDAAEEALADGGTDALPPRCEGTVDLAEPGCALDADLKLLAISVSAKVTVASVDDVATDACHVISPGGPAKRLVLMSDTQQQWTIYVRIPGLPADLVKAGDQLDLAVNAGPGAPPGVPLPGLSQTVVLARDGQLVLFTSSLNTFGVPQVPILDAYGIVVKNDGVICETVLFPFPTTFCVEIGYRALVTIGTQSATVVPGQTIQIGSLSFTVNTFLESGDRFDCDGLSPTKMAGFMTPP